VPDTRAKLLEGWPRKGSAEQMAEMQRIIDAEKSDLFDVLAHVAYALPPLTRDERAARAKAEINTASPPSSRPFSTSCSRTT
jgi:type I restriction enzyme R subunit